MSKLGVFFSSIVFLCSCSSGMLVHDSYQESVVIITKDGQAREGLVLEIQDKELILINGQTKVAEKVEIANISLIEQADTFYDTRGQEIAESHIDKTKGQKNTWLYGTIGSLGGGLIGGLAMGLLNSEDVPDGANNVTKNRIADDNKASIITGALIGAVGGGVYGGFVGYGVDVKKAIEKVRLRRAALYKIEDEKTN